MKFTIDITKPPTKSLKEIRDEFKKSPSFTKEELDSVKSKLEKTNEITNGKVLRS